MNRDTAVPAVSTLRVTALSPLSAKSTVSCFPRLLPHLGVTVRFLRLSLAPAILILGVLLVRQGNPQTRSSHVPAGLTNA